MEIKNIQRDPKLKGKRKISIGFRISEEHSKFMKKHNISPTKLFINCLEDLMSRTK